MRIALLCCVCTGCTPAAVHEPATPVAAPPGNPDPEPVVESVAARGTVSRGDGVVKLSGMIVPTRPRDDRTVTAIGIAIEAAPGAGWLDLRVSTEASDDGGLDYLRCHDLKLRADTSFGDASQREGDAWWLPVEARHEADGAHEAVTASVWRGWVEHLAEASGGGGRICEDEFTLDAAQKETLRALLGELGPVEPGWSEARPPMLIEHPFAKIGIPECDEYVAKYHRCAVEHAPEAVRAMVMDVLGKTVDAWREAAAGSSREHMPSACRTALDAVKQATAAWGCQW